MFVGFLCARTRAAIRRRGAVIARASRVLPSRHAPSEPRVRACRRARSRFSASRESDGDDGSRVSASGIDPPATRGSSSSATTTHAIGGHRHLSLSSRVRFNATTTHAIGGHRRLPPPRVLRFLRRLVGRRRSNRRRTTASSPPACLACPATRRVVALCSVFVFGFAFRFVHARGTDEAVTASDQTTSPKPRNVPPIDLRSIAVDRDCPSSSCRRSPTRSSCYRCCHSRTRGSSRASRCARREGPRPHGALAIAPTKGAAAARGRAWSRVV